MKHTNANVTKQLTILTSVIRIHLLQLILTGEIEKEAGKLK